MHYSMSSNSNMSFRNFENTLSQNSHSIWFGFTIDIGNSVLPIDIILGQHMRLNIIRIIKHFFRTTRRIIGNLRATVMEGSFGNQKLHFGLGVIAARNSRSETLLLFFGIHMANASILAARQLAREEKARAKEIRAWLNLTDFSLLPATCRNA